MNPTLVESAALFKFGLLPGEDLPRVAEQALASGVDTASLPLLLVEADTSLSTVGPLFERCLRELGLNSMTNEACCMAVATYYAKQVVSGALDPVLFGFKLGALDAQPEFPEELRVIFQEAMWYDEAPNEPGYPSDWQSYRSERMSNILRSARSLAGAADNDA